MSKEEFNVNSVPYTPSIRKEALVHMPVPMDRVQDTPVVPAKAPLRVFRNGAWINTEEHNKAILKERGLKEPSERHTGVY